MEDPWAFIEGDVIFYIKRLPDKGLILLQRVIHIPNVLFRIGTKVLNVFHKVKGIAAGVDELLGTVIQEGIAGFPRGVGEVRGGDGGVGVVDGGVGGVDGGLSRRGISR